MIVLVVLLILNYLIYSNLKPNQKLVEVREKYKTLREYLIAVSYTHLTLPTIYSV